LLLGVETESNVDTIANPGNASPASPRPQLPFS
jgi:hypothetical protein